MRTRVLDNIKRLASVEYQRKHIVNGTFDDYDAPRDMIYDTENSINVAIETNELRGEFSAPEIELLSRLKDILSNEDNLESIFDESISAYMLIESDRKWGYIRSEAQKVLKAFE